jgi:hypothetical protein
LLYGVIFVKFPILGWELYGGYPVRTKKVDWIVRKLNRSVNMLSISTQKFGFFNDHWIGEIGWSIGWNDRLPHDGEKVTLQYNEKPEAEIETLKQNLEAKALRRDAVEAAFFTEIVDFSASIFWKIGRGWWSPC